MSRAKPGQQPYWHWHYDDPSDVQGFQGVNTWVIEKNEKTKPLRAFTPGLPSVCFWPGLRFEVCLLSVSVVPSQDHTSSTVIQCGDVNRAVGQKSGDVGLRVLTPGTYVCLWMWFPMDPLHSQKWPTWRCKLHDGVYTKKTALPPCVNIPPNVAFQLLHQQEESYPSWTWSHLMAWLWPVKQSGGDVPGLSTWLSIACVFSVCSAWLLWEHSWAGLVGAERACEAETNPTNWCQPSRPTADALVTDLRCMTNSVHIRKTTQVSPA